MMDKNKAIEHAKSYFSTWPEVDAFHITSDGQAFFSDQDAQAHAAGTRKDKIVHMIQRQEADGSAAAAATEETKGKTK
jgi:hypothetical protein